MKKGTRILLLIAVLAIFMAMAMASGSDDDPKKVGEVGNSTADTTSGSNTDPGNTEAPEVKDEYHVGDILTAKGMKIVYMASGVHEEDNMFMQPGEGKQYIFIRLYCENISNKDTVLSLLTSFSCYADGYAADQFYGGEDSLSANLSAGRFAVGSVYFEVPENAEKIEIECEVDWLAEKKIKFIYDGEKDSGFVPEKHTTGTDGAFSKGDIVETSKVRIAYLSCGENEGMMFYQPREGYRFIFCEFEFENISDSDIFVSYLDFDCYADGQKCNLTLIRDDGLSATLSAGRKAKGTAAFEVPKDAQVIEFEYLTNFWTSNRIVFTYTD